MSLHTILETLIRHTTFRTEAEQHEALEMLDSTVYHDDPAEGALARTAWRPVDASGQPITVPTGMTSAQADELIALLKEQRPRNVLKGESDIIPEDAPTPEVPARPSDPLPPAAPVTAADVPPGVS